MMPPTFVMLVLLLSGSFIVRCYGISLIACNETTPCIANTMICDGGSCHIQPGQICTIPPTITTTSVSSTTPITVSSTTPTVTTSKSTTVTKPSNTTTTNATSNARSTDQQVCVSNASCELNKQDTPMCICKTGFSEVKGFCIVPGNSADTLKGALLSVTTVTSLMLFLI
ncbi:integumentary mucin C.1-like [Dreissena polymorpha]|uniref:EGF-like domain-containing protein n=1 Tax=Dreissena polymorpha TaxID=45954 RepID=A0A9D4GNK5_DREPO|nr:integumentary mucin C.1-like [Dreissena polymorpha]XP_052284606.1 integumentary mucin C.1-like [Dreissena polymorpha]KAH3820270.1 hypothetical protein DPMN_122016 [Dreissena polymorpha]